jgi:hypothetical protein
VAGLRGIGGGIGIAGGEGMGVGDGTGRPPSPITFAPEERERPISPIEFASPLSPPAVDGVQQEGDRVGGEAWEDLAFLSNETGDDDAEVAVIPGGKVEIPPLGGGARGGLSTNRFPSSHRRLRRSLSRLSPPLVLVG